MTNDAPSAKLLAKRTKRVAVASGLLLAGLGSAFATLALRGARPAETDRSVVTADSNLRLRGEPVVEMTVRPSPAREAFGAFPAPRFPDSQAPRRVARTYTCRGTAVFNVDPEEAVVTVDGRVIGTADDWDGMAGGRRYRFRGPGTHYVRLSLRNHATAWVAVVVTPRARQRTADVDLELRELDD